ncbi:hypothetical protein QTJ16_002908 [Diplocarpon rosae]|uniref:Uncharacterized protein n=1 Tax=Diplocarpon rosae TaxID=946125 RepID=A0AAD9WE25_9HELO|nr:hypothetical protein QTJ16_002908 [Diplocarpon rosae]PBP25843.1 SUN domain-containing protein [Diplocarpon rosae]
MKFSHLALLSAATLGVAQPHNHVHKHVARHGYVEDRDSAATHIIPGPVVTVYQLNGKLIPWEEVQAGIASGKYVLTGDEVDAVLSSTFPTPSPVPSYIPAVEISEQESSTSTSTSTTPIPTYVPPPPTTPTPSPTPSPSKESSVASDPEDSTYKTTTKSSPAPGIDEDFPNGSVDCNDFNTLEKYGAVPANWLGLGGYTGIQITPFYSVGASSISDIITGIADGGGCVKKSFCSYACPAGYQKAQYPEAQGANGESLGGLFCNAEGKLELTREGYKTLCQKGVGGVTAESSLDKVVSVCRTDYPGTESETVSVEVTSEGSVDITCPDSKTYYVWQGMATTAQYYINPSGYPKEEACQWGKAGSNIGNWAPVNMGLGRSISGDTFLSLFPNEPTNPDGVLDFKIKITGDVNGECAYANGEYYKDGIVSPTGCTVGVTGEAVVKFY